MATAQKRIMEDKEGTQFFPITHVEAVINNDGDDVATILGDYPKYVLCASEAAYNAIQNKDSGTLYLIPEV